MRILIAEDNRTNQILMEKILEPFGELKLAINGAEAMKSYQAAIEENQPYELICLDIMMPKMDGHMVLSNIRKFEQNNPNISPAKIVMTTACGDEDTVRKLIKYRCDAYMRKPIDRLALIEKLHELDIWEISKKKEEVKEETKAKEVEKAE